MKKHEPLELTKYVLQYLDERYPGKYKCANMSRENHFNYTYDTINNTKCTQVWSWRDLNEYSPLINVCETYVVLFKKADNGTVRMYKHANAADINFFNEIEACLKGFEVDLPARS